MSECKVVRSDMEAKKKDMAITHGKLEATEFIGTVLFFMIYLQFVHIFSLNI